LDSNTALDDCPRFTQRADKATNWNRNEAGIEQEAITTYAITAETSWTLPDNTQQTGTVRQVTQPDGTYHKIYFAGIAGTATGWQRGLPSLVETYDSSNVRQRQSVTTWTQDSPTLAYQLNPRVTETNVYDPADNRARTRVDYASFNLEDGTTCHYPQDTYEYAANASTVMRRTHTTYKTDTNNPALLDPTYVNANRRIIGLVSERTLYEVNPNTGAETLMSKVGYGYDETGSIQGADAPVQHDNEDYGASFREGRANLSSIKRFDVTNTDSTTSSLQYNTAGSVVKATDAAGHYTQVNYGDAFAADGFTLDSGRPTTLAYPTTVTDPDGYASKMRYNYQFGAPTWTQTPRPNVDAPQEGNQDGPIRVTEYDQIGRLKKIRNTFNNAYTRYIYGPNYVETFSTVNTVADEAHSLQVFDGHGRVIGKATNHPGAPSGASAFSGQLIIYDVMGRAIKQSNPTETNIAITGAPINPASWPVMGDDAPGNAGVSPAPGYQPGWYVTTQTYDWKGRPRVTTNQDGTYKEATYSGCGCAGGEVVTLQGEEVPVNSELKRRTEKVYADVLGRQWKTEILNWDGSVYSTTTNTFNARDQVTTVKGYAGIAPADASSTNENAACPDGTCQKTAMTYDGYGRLQSKHVPEQNAGTATVYAYNPDDTIQSVTDARGASATYIYNNNRHLVNETHYSAPSGVTPTANETFEYDAAGNRKFMTDGSGLTSYSYDSLSRLQSETKTFNGLGGSYNISYDYNLANQLKGVTYYNGATVTYGFDTTGRTKTIDGTLYSGVTQYVSDIQYRAWNEPKKISYGNDTLLELAYNSRLNLQRYNMKSYVFQGQRYDTKLVDFQYHADGRLSSAPDATDSRFSRSYNFDHTGRLSQNASSVFSQAYQYNVFDDMTNRVSQFWSQGDTFSATYVNSRNQDPQWQYDTDGNIRFDKDLEYKYDASGTNTSVRALTDSTTITQIVDGDGELAVRGKNNVSLYSVYYLRSTVLDGKILTEFNAYGQWMKNYVYLEGEVLATQVNVPVTGEPGPFIWRHENPLTGARGETVPSGSYHQTVEPDSMGVNVGFEDPYVNPPEEPSEPDIASLYPFDEPSGQCRVEGIVFHCPSAARLLASGVALRCPNDNCNLVWNGHGWETPFGESLNQAPRRNAPTLSRGRERRQRRVSTARRPRRTAGTPQGEEQKVKYPPVTPSEINVVFGGGQFEFVQDDIVNAIVDIANRQACSDAFKKHNLTIPYDVVKSGKLRIAGRAALYQPNASDLLGWTPQQIKDSKDKFDEERGLFGSGFWKVVTAERIYAGIPTVVFNPTQVRNPSFGGLKDVVTHAFIHLGGQRGDPSAEGHDLANFRGYNEILNACR
jgi:YD repeat-containing protein